MPNELDDLIKSIILKYPNLPSDVILKMDELLQGTFKDSEVKEPALRSICESLLDKLLTAKKDEN